MMDLTVVRTLAEEKWHRFVETHPEGNIFHTPEMFKVFAQTKNHTPSLWATVDNEGEPLALLLPVNITVVDGPLRRLTTRAVVYGSVLYQPTDTGFMALELLLETYISDLDKTVLFTEFRNISNVDNSQPILERFGFTHEEHLNYLIDLTQTEDELWNALSKTARKSVKRAQKQGNMSIEVVTDIEKVEIGYQLLQDVYKRVQVPLASRTLFKAAFEILSPKNMIRYYLVSLDDDYIGARFALVYKGRIIGWYAAFHREHAKMYPNELVVWNVLQWGQNHGLTVFDFGGAGRPDQEYGPRQFKAKFGGELVNYGRNICVHQPHLLKISKLGYQLARKFL